MAIGGNGCNYRQVATCPEGSMARMAWHGGNRGGKGGKEKGGDVRRNISERAPREVEREKGKL